MKSELDGKYATLKTSMEVISLSNSGLRPHLVEAAKLLWATSTDMIHHYGSVITFDMLFTASEMHQMFADQTSPRNKRTLGFVDQFRTSFDESIADSPFFLSKLGEVRLFCGDHLWTLFYTKRAILVRSSILIARSFETDVYQDWREDGPIATLLTNILPSEDVALIRASTKNGLSSAIGRLESEFIREANQLMSGSKAIAASLGDMQSLMQLENAKLAERAR